MRKQLMTLCLTGVLASCLMASPWTAPMKPIVHAAENLVGKTGLHVGSEAAVRGGTKLAAVTAERAAARKATKVVLGEITPAKILAGGAGVAAIVGVHEVADGVQSMSEGVGMVARENPDLAREVSGRLMGPIRWFAAVLALCLMGVVTWFAWPFVEVARNWCRLRSAQASHRMEASGLAATEDVGAPPSERRSGRISLLLLVALGGFLLLTMMGIATFRSSNRSAKVEQRRVNVSRPPEPDRSAEIAQRRANVTRLCNVFEESVRRRYESFQREVGTTAASEFNNVRAGIGGVVSEYGTISRCAGLVKTLVVDKCTGDTGTERQIKEDLEKKYYRGLYAARDHVMDCVVRFRSDLELLRASLAYGIAQEMEGDCLPGDEEYEELLKTCGDRIEQAKSDLTEGQVIAGIATVIEAVCIRTTVATVGRVLGKAAVRQAGTMTAGAGACVADGPLPVGDCIAALAVAGCTAWTAWDIYNATEILPKELANTLQATTNECEAKCTEEANEWGKSLFLRYAGLIRQARNSDFCAR